MNFEEMKKILQEMEELLREKNKMYGDENVVKMGKEGVLYRIEEKIERLKHLIKTNQNPEKETLEETWKDIANFGVIGLMLERNKWK
jgi:calcineurin-like phosphoesterase family protein